MNGKRIDAIERRMGYPSPFTLGHWNLDVVLGFAGSGSNTHKVTDREGHTVPITPEIQEQIEQYLKGDAFKDFTVTFGTVATERSAPIEPRGVE